MDKYYLFDATVPVANPGLSRLVDVVDVDSVSVAGTFPIKAPADLVFNSATQQAQDLVEAKKAYYLAKYPAYTHCAYIDLVLAPSYAVGSGPAFVGPRGSFKVAAGTLLLNGPNIPLAEYDSALAFWELSRVSIVESLTGTAQRVFTSLHPNAGFQVDVSFSGGTAYTNNVQYGVAFDPSAEATPVTSLQVRVINSTGHWVHMTSAVILY